MTENVWLGDHRLERDVDEQKLPAKPRPRTEPSKVTLQRRLQDAEREADRVRKQLAALDESEG